MFIGHFAVGFAAKKTAPRASLGALIAAPNLLDLLWPIFLLLGWEEVRIDPGNTVLTPLDFVSYPYTHSLLMAAVWATLFSLIYYGKTRYKPSAVWIWIGVVSHWFFDLIVHRPDLQLYPGGVKAGFGLWNYPVAATLLETLIFVAGVWIYATTTRPIDKVGWYSFWAFVALLVFLYIENIFSSPPPNVTALAIVALIGGWICIPWAGWFDRHRVVENLPAPKPGR